MVQNDCIPSPDRSLGLIGCWIAYEQLILSFLVGHLGGVVLKDRDRLKLGMKQKASMRLA